jgi:membrane protein DedA with SNARE-associated domain
VHSFLLRHGPVGVFIGMILESTGVPVPSEVVLPFAGWLASQGRWTFAAALVVALAGQLVGSLVAYAIGYYGGRPAVLRLERATGRRHLAAAEAWFARHGHWAVLWGRLLPVVRTYISFPAGIGRMPLGRFLVYSAVGALPFSALFLWFGVRFGPAAAQAATLTHALYAVLAVGVVALAVRLLRQRRAR